MIVKFLAVGRAVFAIYPDGSKKLVAVTEFSDADSFYAGYTYDESIEKAKVIAECLNDYYKI